MCLQLGTAGAVTALKAAQVVCNDVKAIDINMGCPLNFSVKGGMGSSLLSKPETVHDIVSTLKRNLPSHIAVTCKIRLLPDEAELLELGRRIEAAGADAVAVHARFIPDRSNSCSARWALARPLCDSLTIPCLANGDVFLPEDAAKVYAVTGCDGIMVGRGAMWNPSIFRGAGIHLRHAQAQQAAGSASGDPTEAPPPAGADDVVPLYDVARAYIGLASWTRNFFQNTKYCLLEMTKGHSRITTSPYYQQYFIRANGKCDIRIYKKTLHNSCSSAQLYPNALAACISTIHHRELIGTVRSINLLSPTQLPTLVRFGQGSPGLNEKLRARASTMLSNGNFRS